MQRDIASDSRKIGKSRHADGDVVSDAGSFDDGLVGMLGQQFSAKMSNHRGSVVSRRSSVFREDVSSG